MKRKAEEKAAGKLTLEQLQQVDPDGAADEVSKSERARALNRASLRHKNTSKWAKHTLARNHIDKGAKRAISDQLKVWFDLFDSFRLDCCQGRFSKMRSLFCYPPRWYSVLILARSFITDGRRTPKESNTRLRRLGRF